MFINSLFIDLLVYYTLGYHHTQSTYDHSARTVPILHEYEHITRTVPMLHERTAHPGSTLDRKTSLV